MNTYRYQSDRHHQMGVAFEIRNSRGNRLADQAVEECLNPFIPPSAEISAN